MEEKESITKQLKKKREKYRSRNKWLILLLICQFLIWWIVNPGFIPGLYGIVSGIKEFFLSLLWPHGTEELLSESYRAYIYLICEWVQQLPGYSILAWAVPRILPVWFLVNLIMIWVTSLRIKHISKPPRVKKPKQKREWKLPTVALPAGKKVSGLYNWVKETRKANLRKLQDSCTELQPEHVLWVGNFAKGASGKAPQDRLYPLTVHNMVRIPSGDGEYQIGLEETQPGCYEAIVRVSGQAPIPLVEGVPLVIAHKNEAGNEIREMTVTWIGGAV